MLEVREEDSIERFVASWEECMKVAPWFDSDATFWYKPEEEIERLRRIHGEGDLFLVAGQEKNTKPLGVLSAQIQDRELSS